MPFMLALKGHQMKTLELSLLRYDDSQNLFLAKPESAPPIEQKWRVAPLRWSAEREPFVILTHRETCRLRLVVAKPDCACELWPVMFSSDQPDAGIADCPITPARCKLVPYMFQGGLYVAALPRTDTGGETRHPGGILQINAPQEPWVYVQDLALTGANRLTPFYVWTSDSVSETYFLVQSHKRVEVWKIVPGEGSLQIWEQVSILSSSGSPLSSSKVQFVYCRTPPAVQASTGCPLAVFPTWVDGCNLFLSRIADNHEWTSLCCVPVPPHSRLGTMYVPFLPEPLLVSTSMDPHYVGSVAVRRLFLAERLLGEESIPRVVRYMQVPAMPIAARDLTADLPITDLVYREFVSDFVGLNKRPLPFDLSGPVGPAVPPPPRPVDHGPIPLLHVPGGLGCLQDKNRLDYVAPEQDTDVSSIMEWKVTPLRWAPPGREVLFVILQSRTRRVTRIAIASPETNDVENWDVQIEFPDSSVPFSECEMTPFQYQTVPGASDLFVVATHEAGGKGGLFFIPNPKTEWQFIREECDLWNVRSVMYHRSKDPNSVNVCTFFLLKNGQIRVLIEPNQPTFPVAEHSYLKEGEMIHVLYAFSPKPPVTHAWPIEVFVCWVEEESRELVVMHVPSPDQEWRLLFRQPVPSHQVCPVYVPYLAEPLLLVGGSDLIRLNLIGRLLTPGNPTSVPRFIHRYLVESGSPELGPLVDLTLDAPLIWIPQMGVQAGMHPYTGYPLPFERQ